MSLSAIVRTMARRWYVSLAGIVLAATAAGAVFMAIPAQYTSSGIAVLAQSKTSANSGKKNPLLTGEDGMDTETLTLVQSLDYPEAGLSLGLDPERETFTIRNVGSSTLNAGNNHPFLYVSTQSDSPSGAIQVVDTVMNAAAQQLATTQARLRIAVQNRITLNPVVQATTPKRVMIKPYAIGGAVAALGLIATAAAACATNALLSRRRTPPRRTDPDDWTNIDWNDLGWHNNDQINLVRSLNDTDPHP